MELERDGVNTTYNVLQETIKKQYQAIVEDLDRLEMASIIQ
jgi:hypothetical protein